MYDGELVVENSRRQGGYAAAALGCGREDTINRHIHHAVGFLAVEWACVALLTHSCNSQGPEQTFCGHSLAAATGREMLADTRPKL